MRWPSSLAAYQRCQRRRGAASWADGERILAERETFRQRAAAVIQGYRTQDLTFRVFRNEALEQYRSLFDLASRYTYLAAKSYDYETGLLGTPQGQAFIASIVASPLAGRPQRRRCPRHRQHAGRHRPRRRAWRRLNADFAVAEGRLGINNPDNNSTVFCLRGEHFRILDDPTSPATTKHGGRRWSSTS